MSPNHPPSLRLPGLQLAAASFLVLALELILIRWIPGQVRVIAYFPNLILISAFLGLGIGCLSPRPVPLWTWPLGVAILAAVSAAMSTVAFTHRATNEYLWLLYYDLPRGSHVVQGIRLPILATFVLSAATFVPLGSFVAARFRQFKEAGWPLAGYGCDLAGSLLGVLAMAALFFSGAMPGTWFAIVFLLGLILCAQSPRAVMQHLVIAVGVVLLVGWTEHAEIYSPYYALNVIPKPGHTIILTNGSLHQDALPLRMSDRINEPRALAIRKGYHIPYRLLRRAPRRVLILGAGTGNDVAVALDEGAAQIDAVEIDPDILALGRLHPDRPYDSPKVRRINTDARAFLNSSREKYDLIVFGTLDSMMRLSALSNVRLDNFVYTVECIRAARAHLAPDGGMALYFMVGTPFIDQHISAMLFQATGERPTVVRQFYEMFNRIYLAGPAYKSVQLPLSTPSVQKSDDAAKVQSVPTDDWPFLYLKNRGVSSFYLSLIAAILVIAIVAIFAVSPAMRASITSGRFDSEMFLFGAAFLLIETKLVTEMNLVWGATWLTSAVVFASILLMVLIGTVWMQFRSLPWTVAASGLVLALLVTWAIPVRDIVGRSLPVRLTASVLFAGLPVLFASICFAILFRQREHPDAAFGWNMLGAVAGGLLEFTSMAIGIKAMTLLALVAYLSAMLIHHRTVTASTAGAVPGEGSATRL
jgi:spermidine synthase